MQSLKQVQKNQKYTFQLFEKDFGFLTRKAGGFFLTKYVSNGLVSHAMKVIWNVFDYVLVERNQGKHE